MLTRRQFLALSLSAASAPFLSYANLSPGEWRQKTLEESLEKQLFSTEAIGKITYDPGGAEYKKRISVTSSMMISNRVTPLDTQDILGKKSIYQDFSNKSLLRYGLGLPVFSPAEAAQILYNSSRKSDMVLYEFFQSDIFGHRKGRADQINLISELDLLLSTLTSLMDGRKDTLLVTSDHGNLEDGESRSHSLNPVPLITWGRGSRELSEKISDLSGITPAIMHFFRS